MVRSLYSAASGMIAQQTNVDVISHNLSNVNTVGYKGQSASFKTLLYQDLQARTTTANGEFKPVSAQVGLGTRVSSITSHYTQGSAMETESNTDFLINGDGFFAIQNLDGETVYTRNGNFYFAIDAQGVALCTSDGYPVLSSDGVPMVFTSDYNPLKITFDGDGNACYPDEAGNPQPIGGMQIALFQFTNPSGLEKIGDNYLRATDASGVPLNEAYDDISKKSSLKSKYLEASNVNVATEMVNLIIAQRAYELCSKAITTSDTMMEQANNLKR